MKKIFFSIIGLIIILVSVISYTFQQKTTSVEPLVIAPFPVVAPNGTNGKVLVTTQTESVTIADPRRSEKMVDLGSGLYQLEGTHTDSEAGFSTAYYETEKSFAIDIWKQPLKEYRKQASEYLLALLEITEDEACRLNVYVGTTYDVDPELSGQNLGLSFCPGAISL